MSVKRRVFPETFKRETVVPPLDIVEAVFFEDLQFDHGVADDEVCAN
ncbi:hypothetical protein [Caulobacter sp. 602-1]|nr:hypothetical protein [Caulobacter sp. 602-1]